MSNFERHILFVDDDRTMQRIITLLLEPRGVKVTSADNGRDALDILETGLIPDIIIADLEMPVMNGLDFFRAVRANETWLHIPFIVLTAHNERPDMRQAFQLGVDDYITKPFDGERLILSIYSKAKRTQQLTNYARSAYDALDYIRRDMARMFTHELRTPLVSINMAIELLSRHGTDFSSAEAQELFTTLESGVTRLNRLVEQMVLLTQLDMGELQKTIVEGSKPGPLWDAVTAATNQARAFSHRQRDVTVEYSGADVDGTILAEWRSLRHALAELLSNAMAFSPRDQPVTVSQWRDKDRIMLTITDRGPGIPHDKQGDLFQRFHQVERERHEQQGIGMGLYLAKNIIEATGGTLTIESDEGQGTSATAGFPVIS